MFKIDFFVDDKNLAHALRGLSGLARDLKAVPVINAEPARNGKIKQATGTTLEQIALKLAQYGGTEITTPMIKDAVKDCGLSITSHNHFSSALVKNKVLKKLSKTGQPGRFQLVK